MAGRWADNSHYRGLQQRLCKPISHKPCTSVNSELILKTNAMHSLTQTEFAKFMFSYGHIRRPLDWGLIGLGGYLQGKHRLRYEGGGEAWVLLDNELWHVEDNETQETQPSAAQSLEARAPGPAKGSTREPLGQPAHLKAASGAKHTRSLDGLTDLEGLIGTRVRVWWPDDECFYEGSITAFSKRKVSFIWLRAIRMRQVEVGEQRL